MPANIKYLTASPWTRAAKITAGILGGLMVSASMHTALAAWFNHVNVIITYTYTGFILWVVLMILAFLARSGWKIWLLYSSLTILFTLCAYLSKWYNPDFMNRG